MDLGCQACPPCPPDTPSSHMGTLKFDISAPYTSFCLTKSFILCQITAALLCFTLN